ncbi:MAG: hypothetical protein N3F66_13760 [Spirochaetes bacterium]|nr:hypothetical protein [Spirochaetota bacterium]
MIVRKLKYSIILPLLYTVPLFSTSQNVISHNEFFFLPNAGILLDYSSLHTKTGFNGKQSKIIDLMLIKYKNYNLSTYIVEDIYTTSRFNSRYYPYRIAYYMDYGYFSYTLSNSQIGIVLNHICYNTFDKQIYSINDELRWYGIGIKWQSTGMQIGYKDSLLDHNSSIFNLNTINYYFYLGYPFFSKNPTYKYMSSCIVRFDIPLLLYATPYIMTQLNGLMYQDNTIAIDRSVEIGLRLTFSHITITPYWYYGYINDSIYPNISDTQFAIGCKAESLIGYDNSRGDNVFLFYSDNAMSMHFIAGYGKNLNSKFYNFTTDLGLSLQTQIFDKNTLYFASYLNHSSRSQATALYPRFINILLESGYYQSITQYYYAHILYQHYRRHDGNEYRGQTENYHAVGISLKHGYLDNCNATISTGYNNYCKPNTVDYELGALYIVAKQNYPYSFIINPSLYYYCNMMANTIPYTGITLLLYAGREYNYEYSIESGVIFDTYIPLIIYYSFKRDIDIDIVCGGYDFYHIIGIRLKL